MTSPFVCRRCVARLKPTPSHATQLQKSSFHNSAPSRGESKSAANPYRRRPKKWRSILKATPDGVTRSRAPWDSTIIIRKYPEKRPGFAATEDSLVLKQRILSNQGYYHGLKGDLQRIYNLSSSEARHAAQQVRRYRRLSETGEVAMKIDLFLLWKQDFSRVLKAMNPDATTQMAILGTANGAPEPESAPVSKAPSEAEWFSLSRKQRKVEWARVSHRLLRTDFHELFSFAIFSFHMSIRPPPYIIEDILYIIARNLDRFSPADQRRFADLAQSVIQQTPFRYICLDQYVLYRLTKLLSPDELRSLHKELIAKEHPLFPIHPNTLLHFASQLAKSTETKAYAADILCSLTQKPDFDINSAASASVCTAILDVPGGSTRPREGEAEPDRLLKLLMEHGLRPNIINLTALAENFITRGRVDTVWRMLDIFQQYGIEPDNHVFSVLMRGCSESAELDSIQRLIDLISSRNAWTPYVVNSILAMLARSFEYQTERRRRQLKDHSAWRPMVQLYAKFFKMAPLQNITRFPLENLIHTPNKSPGDIAPFTDFTYALPRLPDVKTMRPDNYTLILMIGAHIRSIKNPLWVYRYFTFFRDLLAKDDRRMMSIVETHGSQLFDIFLRAFMQFRASIPKALEIRGRMVRHQKGNRGATRGRWAPPSIYTWNILANGFKNHRSPTGVVGMIRMMKENGGFVPNHVTWNILVGAFARVGDTNGAVIAMRQMEKAGFVSDARTLEAFKALPRKERENAIKLLQEYREEDETGGAVSDIQGLDRYTRDTHGTGAVKISKRAVMESQMTLYERRKLRRNAQGRQTRTSRPLR